MQTPADSSSRAYHNWIDDSGNNNDAAYYQAPGFEYAFEPSTGHHPINVEVQHMEPFERLLSLHTSEQWMLDQVPWQATYPENSFMDQSSRSLYCNPADLLPRTSSAPPLASHTTPEPEGSGVHRTASTIIKTARRSNVTKGAPHIAPLERPATSLEGRPATTGRTARKHKLYLSVSTCDQWTYQPSASKLELTPILSPVVRLGKTSRLSILPGSFRQTRRLRTARPCS